MAEGDSVDVVGSFALNQAWLNTSLVKLGTGSSVTGANGSFQNEGEVVLDGNASLMPAGGVFNDAAGVIRSIGALTRTCAMTESVVRSSSPA